MEQHSSQNLYSFGGCGPSPFGLKNMKYSQSHEDFRSLELDYEFPLRKRIWSTDYLPFDSPTDVSNGFLDSQVNYGYTESTPTSSSQKPAKKEKKKATREDFVTKFKTEICKYWEEKGSCPYGKRCAFAHGTQDKRYKGNMKERRLAIKCVNFHQNGYCAYGRRCQYQHFSTTTLGKSEFCYQEKLNDPAFFELHDGKCQCSSRPRLMAFEQITSSVAATPADSL